MKFTMNIIIVEDNWLKIKEQITMMNNLDNLRDAVIEEMIWAMSLLRFV